MLTMLILTSVFVKVGRAVEAAVRSLLLLLCKFIYSFFMFAYEIFEQFGNLHLMNDQFSGIYTRVGLILGLFMVFRLTFYAIEYIVNPDNMFDSKKGIGNIIKKVLIVVVLLGSTRFLFNEAFEINDFLIDSDFVGRIIIGPSSGKQNNGEIVAWEMFSAFYRTNEKYITAKGDGYERPIYCDFEPDDKTAFMYQNFIDRSFSFEFDCVNYNNYTDDDEDANLLSFLHDAGEFLGVIKEPDDPLLYVIDFEPIPCIIVGGIMLWILITYTIQVAIRAFQLLYLEIIAPIPIMMYLTSDGDSKLKAWGQQCLTTFLDFFIRVAILDFVMELSVGILANRDKILEPFADIAENEGGFLGKTYVIVIVIVAIMIFAKRIPSLLQEILPSTGGAASLGFGIGMTGEAKKAGGFLGGLAGGAIGATVGGVANAGISAIDNMNAAGRIGRNRFGAAMHGLGSGAIIGIRNGAKKGNVFKNFGAGMSARKAADRSYEQLLAEGGSATGKLGSQISSHFGMTKGQEYERMRSNANKMDEFVKNIRSSVEKVDAVQKAKSDYENFTPTADMDEPAAKARRAWLYQRYKDMRDGYIDLALNNKIDLNTYEDFDGNKLNGNDLLYLTEARQQGNAANTFAQSVNATTVDTNSEEGKFTEIVDAASLGRVGLEANTTERMIVGSEDYIRATADDKAAGVNDSKK